MVANIKDKKILIVEDDKDFSFILQINFQNEGFIVIVANDGVDGLAKAEAEKPDLMILDILMPNMNGIEMAKKIKSKGINVPIIFLTNLSDIDFMTRAEEAVMADYVIKSDVPTEKIVAMVKDKLGV